MHLLACHLSKGQIKTSFIPDPRSGLPERNPGAAGLIFSISRAVIRPYGVEFIWLSYRESLAIQKGIYQIGYPISNTYPIYISSGYPISNTYPIYTSSGYPVSNRPSKSCQNCLGWLCLSLAVEMPSGEGDVRSSGSYLAHKDQRFPELCLADGTDVPCLTALLAGGTGPVGLLGRMEEKKHCEKV